MPGLGLYVNEEFGLITYYEDNVLSELESKYSVEVAQSVIHTEALMQQGEAQLTNTNDGIIGYPDFLIRQSNGEYQAADAKLSLSSEKKKYKFSLASIANYLETTCLL